eukprot:2098496-Amphidinium_carterae.1
MYAFWWKAPVCALESAQGFYEFKRESCIGAALLAPAARVKLCFCGIVLFVRTRSRQVCGFSRSNFCEWTVP